ncbi:MAG TPA: hypothetical protein VFT53_06350 [Candidatus Saccharimonadales bacterium]|nr:hypothetical protein [Candidatus Saccharimonadales bacterium]
MAEAQLRLYSAYTLNQQARQMAELVGQGFQPQAVGLSAEALVGKYSTSAAATHAAMVREDAQPASAFQATVHDEAGALMGLIKANLRPDVHYLRWNHLNPQLARSIPFAYVPLAHIQTSIAAMTDARPNNDPGAEYLASALRQALGILALNYRRGFAATIVPGRPPQPSSPPLPTDRLHRALHESTREMQQIMVGHFAVRTVDGKIDTRLLAQESTLYATTRSPGADGLDELRYEPNDFRTITS